MNFTWKIENFGCIKDEVIVSPSFELYSKLFEIRIHPCRYSKSDDSISVTLQSIHSLETSNYYRYGQPNCSFGFLDWEGSPLVWHVGQIQGKLVATSCYRLVYTFNMIKNDIFGSRKSSFLPNNALTLQCCLWRTQGELALPTLRLVTSHIESRSEIIKKSFSFTVEEIKSLQQKPLEKCMQMSRKGEHCLVKLVWDKLQLALSIELTSCKVFMGCKVRLKENSGKDILFENGINYFHRADEVWKFMTGIFSDLFLYFPNRFSHLGITCTFSDDLYLIQEDKHDSHRQIRFSSINIENPSNTMSKDLKDMYTQDFLSDFKLKAGEREFNVHKAVLGARSSVFRAMFTSGMIETESGCTDIKDVDADTLQRMLEFIYADKVEGDMDCDSSSCLYVAADKYSLVSLKQYSSALIASSLCVESVLDVLLLADKHSDDDLKSAAQDFISRNDKEIVGQEKWKDFEEENSKLALKTLGILYMKKMNK